MGTTYYYEISASNSAGTSSLSGTTSAATSPPAYFNITFPDGTVSAAQLTSSDYTTLQGELSSGVTVQSTASNSEPVDNLTQLLSWINQELPYHHVGASYASDVYFDIVFHDGFVAPAHLSGFDYAVLQNLLP